MSDLVERLRHHHRFAMDEHPPVYPADSITVHSQAADEIERLEQWKREATEVIAGWELLADLLPSESAYLGRSKSAGVFDQIVRLQAIIESVPADRWNPWHTVTIRKGSWHMAHPITCVLDDCAFDGLAQAEWDQPPHDVGVWRWHDFDDEPWDWEQEQ